MYAFESGGSRAPLHAMVIGSVIAAVALFTVSGFEGMPVPYVFQILAVICLTATVYLVSHYSLKSYRYAIEPSVTPACKDAIREFSLYRWEEDGQTDRVQKENDHAMDDIRYFCATVMRRERRKNGGKNNEELAGK